VTYVIAEPCIGEKNGACVDVCPAGCIHTTPDAPQNYIDPGVCIECEQCVLVCPVNAVFLDKELPEEWAGFVDVNAAFFRANKPAASLGLEHATRMLEAVATYASRMGLQVAAAVLDRHGSVLASSGADALVEQATHKAYTALMYGVATHELKPASRPLWHEVAEIDAGRVLLQPGAFPVIEGVETLGAVGVAGATPDQNILCCQAALASRFVAAH
jgi:ferredoxin